MVRAADHVICCSHYMRGHVTDVFGVSPAKVTAIPNGIDPTDLQPVADLPRLRARFAAPDEKLVLLVGRLVYEKGFHLALDALGGEDGVIERLGDVRFLVAGSGTHEEELRQQATELGLDEHGTFLGWIGDDVLRDRLVAEASEHVLGFDWADVAAQTAAIYAGLRGARTSA